MDYETYESITIRTDYETTDALDRVALALDRDRVDVIRDAIAHYLRLHGARDAAAIDKCVFLSTSPRIMEDMEVEEFFSRWEGMPS